MSNKRQIIPAYISLGGNINPELHLQNALKQMKQDFDGMECSSVYQSRAVGFDGDDFLNMVVKIDSHLSIGRLNDYLHELEDSEGRTRANGKAWDSRTLDLDILLYGEEVGKVEGVELPRGEILEHAHVLMPLVDIAGDNLHPSTKKTFNALLDEVDFADQQIWKVEFS